MFAISLGILSGLLQIYGYIFYARKTILGHIKPNTASWGLWAFGAVLESGSYIFATGDWAKNILPAACALSAIAFFFLALYKGHFRKLDSFEYLIITLDLIAILIWWYTESALYANIYIVLTAVISFIPIFRHAWKNPEQEDAGPWFIWTWAYALLTVIVILNFTIWQELIFPVTYIFLSLTLAILSLDSRIPKTFSFRRLQ